MNSQNIRSIAILILAAVLTLGGLNVYAGVSTSGGGIGVLCGKRTATQKLQLLDLYEASVSEQELIQSTGTFGGDYSIALKRLRNLISDPRPVTQDEIIEDQQNFKRHTEFTNKKLIPTRDAGFTPSLPSSCHYVQIAVYHDFNNKLIVNKELWDQLDSLNQAALLTHEVIYKMQRVASYADSYQVRSLVRELFLKNGPTIKGPRDGLIAGQGAICFAGDTSTNSDFTFVWQGKKIRFLTLAGDARFAKTSITVPVSIDELKLEPVIIESKKTGYRVSYTPRDFEIKNQTFDSELPIPHITWNQKVQMGELFSVGINVRGKTLSYPVKACFNYK